MLSVQPFRNRTYRGSTCNRRYSDHLSPGNCGTLVFFQSRRYFHGLNLMSVVIEAENISKRFFLGERNQRAFFEDVAAKSVRGLRRLIGPKDISGEKDSARDFWALQD